MGLDPGFYAELTRSEPKQVWEHSRNGLVRWPRTAAYTRRVRAAGAATRCAHEDQPQHEHCGSRTARDHQHVRFVVAASAQTWLL